MERFLQRGLLSLAIPHITNLPTSKHFCSTHSTLLQFLCSTLFNILGKVSNTYIVIAYLDLIPFLTPQNLETPKCNMYANRGLNYKAVPRLCECCRQVEAKEVSNSRNKIHQTWERPYSGALYSPILSKVDLYSVHSA